MIPDYFLQKLVEHADKMRGLQKSLQAEKNNCVFTPSFFESLNKAEKEFYEVLVNVKELVKVKHPP